MSSKKLPWGMILFSLPFAGVGLGFLVLSIIPTLYEWQAMSRWQPSPASVTQAELKVSHGDDSTSYQATATYSYTINGRTYTNSRVGINSGYDNIGSWQKDKSAALKRYRTNKDLIIVYVNPNNPQDSIIYPELRTSLFIFKIVFAFIFGGVGFGLLFFSLKKNKRTDSQKLTSNRPWEADKDWQNPIKSNAQLGIWVAWGFAIIWNLISFPVAISAIPKELAKNNYPALLILLFPLIGLFLFRWALKSTAAWRHFGPTPLWLEPYPGAIGGHIGGTIKCHKKLNPNTANITLECIYHYQSGSGKNRQSQQRVVWQTQGSTAVTVLNIAGAPESQIKFCFDVPSALPASELSASSYHSWRVTLDLIDHGTALNRQFTIPAFPSTQQSQLNITDTASNDLTQDKQQQELGALLNIQPIVGGITLQHKVGRNAKTNSVLLIIGLVFFGAGIGMGLAKDAPLFMAIIFSLVGGALSLFGFYKLLNSYYVKIGNRGLYTERYILGIKTSQHTHTPATIKHLKIKHTGSSTSGNTHTEHFIIQAHLQNGKTVNVAESINGRAMAEYALESISMLSGYPANS